MHAEIPENVTSLGTTSSNRVSPYHLAMATTTTRHQMEQQESSSQNVFTGRLPGPRTPVYVPLLTLQRPNAPTLISPRFNPVLSQTLAPDDDHNVDVIDSGLITGNEWLLVTACDTNHFHYELSIYSCCLIVMLCHWHAVYLRRHYNLSASSNIL